MHTIHHGPIPAHAYRMSSNTHVSERGEISFREGFPRANEVFQPLRISVAGPVVIWSRLRFETVVSISTRPRAGSSPSSFAAPFSSPPLLKRG